MVWRMSSRNRVDASMQHPTHNVRGSYNLLPHCLRPYGKAQNPSASRPATTTENKRKYDVFSHLPRRDGPRGTDCGRSGKWKMQFHKTTKTEQSTNTQTHRKYSRPGCLLSQERSVSRGRGASVRPSSSNSWLFVHLWVVRY